MNAMSCVKRMTAPASSSTCVSRCADSSACAEDGRGGGREGGGAEGRGMLPWHPIWLHNFVDPVSMRSHGLNKPLHKTVPPHTHIPDESPALPPQSTYPHHAVDLVHLRELCLNRAQIGRRLLAAPRQRAHHHVGDLVRMQVDHVVVAK
eukprot:360760-Chlamydomonas_euryale.AAC.1